MIEIRHKTTGAILYTVDAETLRNANLIGANLADVDLTFVDLTGANLNSANLSGAYLTGAFLYGANLVGTDLTFADLTGAHLYDANLRRANLNGAKFAAVLLASTSFLNCRTLHEAKGLDFIIHTGPSYLDAITLRSCVRFLPDVFLLGVGYTNEEIETLRAMYSDGGIQYYSCFLSYAHLNSDFADRLRTDLIANGVSCWQDTQDLRSGQKWEGQINTAIKAHDKLVLFCSRQSVYRPQVVREILQAIWTERETGEQKLFPIRLDDQILSAEMLEDAREKVRSGEWSENWVYEVRKYQIADFTQWKDHDAYQKALAGLLRDLKKTANV
jgi:hypothetical protein